MTAVLFARHEARLALRDAAAFLRGGNRRRGLAPLLWFAGFAIVLHAIAFAVVPFDQPIDLADPVALMTVSGAIFFAFALMLAQAMESVTRAVYGRGDLDLVLSSPAPVSRLFALRTGVLALGTALMASLLIGPFIHILAWRFGAGWLSAYGVLLAMGAVATALATVLTLVLFRLIGPQRTRFVAQVVAAVIGAGFVVGAQAVAIVGRGEFSRFAVFRSEFARLHMPGPDSPVWWPARAAAGDPAALAATAAVGGILLAGALVLAGWRLPSAALASAGVPEPRGRPRPRAGTGFRMRSPAASLRAKEIALILRDPWLVSQSLMQILYLIPPALMLWKGFGSDLGTAALLVPIVVMGAGQLAGGLAWLTLSGEDAPDLIASAPVSRWSAVRAKIEAVLVAVAAPVGPIVAALTFAAPAAGAVAAGGVLASALAAAAIQFLFRTRSRRSQFRRRQTASRAATFAEAFSSLSWAAAAALAAAGTILAAAPAAVALLVLLIAYAVSPRSARN